MTKSILMRSALLATLAAGVVALIPDAATARDGRGSSDGDSYERQLQQNPAFLEPYGYADPATYRLGHPREGYYARQYLEYRGPRGAVRVSPYGDY